MIVLGRLVVPYGVRGWFKLHPFADDAAAWCALSEWWLAADPDAAKQDADWRIYRLEEVREHGKGLIAKLFGVDDRSAAEKLQGFFVAAPRNALPITADNEYYWDDLIDLEVKNGKDESLGKVEELITATANDVLVVVEGETKRLLPFVGSVVKEVDVLAGVIRVDWERDW